MALLNEVGHIDPEVPCQTHRHFSVYLSTHHTLSQFCPPTIHPLTICPHTIHPLSLSLFVRTPYTLDPDIPCQTHRHVSVYLMSPIYFLRPLFRAKIDGFVSYTQLVNSGIGSGLQDEGFRFVHRYCCDETTRAKSEGVRGG